MRHHGGGMKRLVATLLAALVVGSTAGLAASGGTTTTTTTTAAPKKWFVCKYVTKPGEDERLQTGQNPISVSENAIPISPVFIGAEFADAQGRSVVIAADVGQPEPDVSECPSPHGGTTTTSTTTPETSTTSTSTTSTSTTSTQPGTTSTSSSTSTTSTTTTTPPTTSSSTSSTSSSTTSSTSTTAPSQTASTTTTSLPVGSTSTTTTSTSSPSSTSTSSTTTTVPETLDIAALAPVCIGDAPFIEIVFGNQPQFDGETAVVTFIAQATGEVVATHNLIYQANSTARVIYPGASVDPVTGEALDWPGWRFEESTQLWVPDPTDDFLRDGLNVSIAINPTALGEVEYPPATAACASPENPPTTTTTTTTGTPPEVPPGGVLPPTQ